MGSWFALVAWVGGLWAVIVGVRWWVRPARRAEIVGGYALRTVTWLIALVPMLALLLLILVVTGVEDAAGGPVLAPIAGVVACVTVLVAASRVVRHGSVRAAWVMVVVAVGATVAVVVPQLVASMRSLDQLVDTLGFVLLEAPMLGGGIVNALLAVGRTRASAVDPEESVEDSVLD